METWTARIEIDRATFSTKKGGRPGRKKLVKKGEMGMNLHAGTPRKGLGKQYRPFWNFYRTDCFGDDLENSGASGELDSGHIRRGLHDNRT
jgi:hypothetical protein